jgi:hypothetical protein
LMFLSLASLQHITWCSTKRTHPPMRIEDVSLPKASRPLAQKELTHWKRRGYVLSDGDPGLTFSGRAFRARVWVLPTPGGSRASPRSSLRIRGSIQSPGLRAPSPSGSGGARRVSPRLMEGRPRRRPRLAKRAAGKGEGRTEAASVITRG